MWIGAEPADLPSDAVEVGRIIDAWGIKGGVKLQPYSADPQALFSSKRWFLTPGAAQKSSGRDLVVCLPIEQARNHGAYVVATSSVIGDRDAALALKGASVHVRRSSFPTAAADEFYWVDLIGCQVVNKAGLSLGRIHDLLSAGPQTVMVLRDDSSNPHTERLIPFVSAFVDKVDIGAKQVSVDWEADY